MFYKNTKQKKILPRFFSMPVLFTPLIIGVFVFMPIQEVEAQFGQNPTFQFSNQSSNQFFNSSGQQITDNQFDSQFFSRTGLGGQEGYQLLLPYQTWVMVGLILLVQVSFHNI